MPPELTFGADDVRVLEDETVFDGYFSVRRVKVQYRAFGGGWVAPRRRSRRAALSSGNRLPGVD